MTYERVERLLALTMDEWTWGNTLGPAMEITDRLEAQIYFRALVDETERRGIEKHPERSVWLCKQNLGYFAGYYDSETMDRVNDLFDTEHPVFGRSHPTAEEALNVGYELGAAMRGKE